MYETFFSRRAALVFDSVERFVLPGFFCLSRSKSRICRLHASLFTRVA